MKKHSIKLTALVLALVLTAALALTGCGSKTDDSGDSTATIQIAVPNDTTNEARALQLLAAQGLITVRDGAGLTATINDITENPHNLKIEEIEAAQLPRTVADVDFAVINGNYALAAGLKISDALATEDANGTAAQKFLVLVDDGTLPLLVLPGHLIEDDDPGLEAVIAGVTLCHLQVAVLAQNDGAGGVLAVVIVVDEVGFFGKGIQAVLLAGLEENFAFGIGGFLTDEVADIREADGHVLAVGRSDLHGLGRAGSLQSAALGGTLLHCSHPGGGGGASGVCGHGGRRCAGTRKSHK